MVAIITSKTKIDPILGIERKFETSLEEENVISFDGSFSSVLKIRDENGQIYAGKFPFKFNEQEWTQKDCPAMAEILVPSLNHENFISKELCNKFDLSLKPEGVFLVKVFQGAGFEDFYRLMRSRFAKVATRKPKASRDRSCELYLVGSGRIRVE